MDVTLSRSISGTGSTPTTASGQTTVSCESVTTVGPVTVPGAGNVIMAPVSIDVSELAFLDIRATGDCVLTTNDTGSPVHTITLKADCALSWDWRCGLANPFISPATDITQMKCTKATATSATLTIRYGIKDLST